MSKIKFLKISPFVLTGVIFAVTFGIMVQNTLGANCTKGSGDCKFPCQATANPSVQGCIEEKEQAKGAIFSNCRFTTIPVASPCGKYYKGDWDEETGCGPCNQYISGSPAPKASTNCTPT